MAKSTIAALIVISMILMLAEYQTLSTIGGRRRDVKALRAL